jgi:hypothetical protein
MANGENYRVKIAGLMEKLMEDFIKDLPSVHVVCEAFPDQGCSLELLIGEWTGNKWEVTSIGVLDRGNSKDVKLKAVSLGSGGTVGQTLLLRPKPSAKDTTTFFTVRNVSGNVAYMHEVNPHIFPWWLNYQVIRHGPGDPYLLHPGGEVLSLICANWEVVVYFMKP